MPSAARISPSTPTKASTFLTCLRGEGQSETGLARADGDLLATAGQLEPSAQFFAEEEADHDRVAFDVPRIGARDGLVNAPKDPSPE